VTRRLGRQLRTVASAQQQDESGSSLETIQESRRLRARPVDHARWNFLRGRIVELMAFLKVARLSGERGFHARHEQEAGFDDKDLGAVTLVSNVDQNKCISPAAQ
jgi:hypothetical protein